MRAVQHLVRCLAPAVLPCCLTLFLRNSWLRLMTATSSMAARLSCECHHSMARQQCIQPAAEALVIHECVTCEEVCHVKNTTHVLPHPATDAWWGAWVARTKLGKGQRHKNPLGALLVLHKHGAAQT